MEHLRMVILGFISGSIMYSYCIPKLILKKDVRTGTKDENPGGYNAFMVNKKLGLFCILLDMLKGFIPVCLFAKEAGVNTPWIFPMLLAPVLGHAFTPFFKGKGGKALATTAGSMMGLIPCSKVGILLIFLAFFFSVIIQINPFEMRVAIVMLSFNALLLVLKLANLWVQLAAWSITGILWYKQMEKKLEDKPFTYTPIWKKA